VVGWWEQAATAMGMAGIDSLVFCEFLPFARGKPCASSNMNMFKIFLDGVLPDVLMLF
jgi:hypothetical protein